MSTAWRLAIVAAAVFGPIVIMFVWAVLRDHRHARLRREEELRQASEEPDCLMGRFGGGRSPLQ